MSVFSCSVLRGSTRFMPTSRQTMIRSSSPMTFYSKSNHQLLNDAGPNFCCLALSRSFFSESPVDSIVTNPVTEKLLQSDNVFALQHKLIQFHDVTGLPWWATIIVSTIALRTLIIFPFATHQQYVIYKNIEIDRQMNTNVKQEVSKYVNDLAEKNKLSADEMEITYYMELRNRRQQLCEKNNSHPLKTAVLVFIQLPAWMFMSGAIRNITSMSPVRDHIAIQAYMEMKASGFWIFKDLTVPDHSWTLPVLIILINLIIIEINQISRINKKHWLRTLIVNSMRGFSILSFFIIINVPKSMTIFWLTSALCGLVQNILFLNPTARKILRIPHSNTVRERPFSRMKNKIKGFFYFFKY